MNEHVQRIHDMYRAVVADSGTEKIAREQAIHLVAAQIQPLIDAGEIQPDTYSWVKALVVAADRADGAAADKVLAAIARGEDDLTTESMPYLDFVVTLGGGGRKVYRFLSLNDLDEMDELRHRNVRSVNRSYHKDWKPAYEGWRAVLRRNLTIGAAVEAGDLPTDSVLFEAS